MTTRNPAIAVSLLLLVSLLSTSAPVAADSDSQTVNDDRAAKQLLDLVNRERANAQLPPLAWDAGLARAARAHVLAMAAAHVLTHQLKNEPSLPVRLVAATSLRLDAEGENVALNVTVQGAHQGLMNSPPHRENILDAHFNYAGFATAWEQGQLWVVEDFGHAMRSYSAEDAENRIAAVIASRREKTRLRPFRRVPFAGLHDVACGMARADSLQTSAVASLSKTYNVVIYTQTDLAVFPESRLIARPDLQNVSLATCFEKTTTYPGGMYWVVVLFY